MVAKSFFALSVVITALIAGLGVFHYTRSSSIQEASPLSNDDTAVNAFVDPYANWQRPPGPPKVALQVGHWKNQELPDEFERLRETGGGSSGGGKAEWEVNLAIAEATAELLRTNGITVDILPATIPPEYWADVFIAIHADGNENSAVSGYKIAAPWRDRTGKAEELVSLIQKEYDVATQLSQDSNITHNMRGYYAFNWRRYEHALHPMTTAAIIETGFLTSPQDRKVLTKQPELPAQGIANGIKAYLNSQQLA